MRLLHCSAQNFGSYERLEFDFTNLGLTLIHGPTGAGKSTLMDIPCWAIFGVTAKDGSVDEVRSWTTPDQPTTVKLTLETRSGSITITRIRGRNKDNDLFWTRQESPSDPIRGKDLSESQKTLNQIIGCDSVAYLTSAYFSEFSGAGTFFKANTKTKRAYFETLTNLEWVKTLSANSHAAHKVARTDEERVASDCERISRERKFNQQNIKSYSLKQWEWERAHVSTIDLLKQKQKNFEKEKNEKIKIAAAQFSSWATDNLRKQAALTEEILVLEKTVRDDAVFKAEIDSFSNTRCELCGARTHGDELHDVKQARQENAHLMATLKSKRGSLADLEARINPHMQELLHLEKLENGYAERVQEAKEQENPYTAYLTRAEEDDTILSMALDCREKELTDASARKDRLMFLQELAVALRGEMIRHAVEEVQDKTNHKLEAFFDSEIKISLAIEDEDSLSVSIQKNGYECSYSQLSKGQRGLLRLCFGVSAMSIAANKVSEHFSVLMLDEALDGLDSELKLKAFSLFEELATQHESVLLIDHAIEFQTMFSNKFQVSLNGDASEISHDG